MEREYRRPATASERELLVLNQRAERDRTQRLQLIDKEFRFSHRTLQQRKDFWRKEQRKIGPVRICEPKAIADVAMREINELGGFREARTAHGTRRNANMGPDERQGRSISAPARQRCSVQGGVSLLQMKNIALIDSISEREKALRRQRAREEMERKRRAQREALQRRVEEFVEKLSNRGRVEATEEPP